MKILKRPDNLIFDTENSEKITENLDHNHVDLQPLHESLAGGEWAYLSKQFVNKDGTQHQILDNFGKSYFYIVEQ